MVPRGLEPRTLQLLAVRSNQLSYETLRHALKMQLLGPRQISAGDCTHRHTLKVF